ncbi:MAG: EcsC family protein [Nocardioidaceae bacterium]|nr:EcsC family protein [Nocardioidaceae bacterium]
MAGGKIVGRLARPLAERAAPGLTSGFVRQAFERALDGVGPLKGAAEAADSRLADADGDVDKAVRALVDSHVKLAGIQGFVTNLGGLVTMAVTVPANISGLALLQCHLVAGIAHLRGYDVKEPRVRNAVLACMLGEDAVTSLVRKKRLPSSPMAIATAPHHDPELDRLIATEVTAELITRVAGKRTAAVIGRRLPIVGGGVGAVTDGYGTYLIGRYAAKELRARGTAN